MRLLLSILLLAAFSTPLFSQQHLEYWNNDPVASDVHWLAAGVETEVTFSVLPKHDKGVWVEAVLSESENCATLEYEQDGVQDVTVTVTSNVPGRCRIRIKLFEFEKVISKNGKKVSYRKTVLVGKYFANLQVFEAEEQFPSTDGMNSVAYRESAKEWIPVSIQFANATPTNEARSVSTHLLNDDNSCVTSPMRIRNQAFLEGTWTAEVQPNAFGWHSLQSRVRLANGKIGNLYFTFVAAQKRDVVIPFPNSTSLNTEIEMLIVPSYRSLTADTKASLGAESGVISEQYVDGGVLHIIVTFASLPATLKIKDPEIQTPYDVLIGEDTAHVKELKKCVRKHFDGVYTMNKEDGCLDLAKSIGLSAVMKEIKPKVAEKERLTFTIAGGGGKSVIVYLHGPDQQPAKPETKKKVAKAETGENRNQNNDGFEGDEGDEGDLSSNSGRGGRGGRGSQGPTGRKGGRGGFIYGEDGKNGTNAEKMTVKIASKECPFLCLVFGTDGGDAGDGQDGSIGGDGGIGGKGGTGGEGGIGGEGADGNGGSGGRGGRGGNGGPGGIGGQAGQGGPGGGGGDCHNTIGGKAAEVIVSAPDNAYVIVRIGDGGKGGNGGNGATGGEPGSPGSGGDPGPKGLGGPGGDGVPAGNAGPDGNPSTVTGPIGANSTRGGPGKGGKGGPGGKTNKATITGGCDEADILDGATGTTGDSGNGG